MRAIERDNALALFPRLERVIRPSLRSSRVCAWVNLQITLAPCWLDVICVPNSVRVPRLMLVSGRNAAMSRSKLRVRRRASTAWIGAAIVCLASTQVPAQQGSLLPFFKPTMEDVAPGVDHGNSDKRLPEDLQRQAVFIALTTLRALLLSKPASVTCT
jgi:hypothetical protein